MKNHSEYNKRQAPRPIRTSTDCIFGIHVPPLIRATPLNRRDNLVREISTPFKVDTRNMLVDVETGKVGGHYEELFR